MIKQKYHQIATKDSSGKMIIKRMKLKYIYNLQTEESDDFELNDVLLDTSFTEEINVNQEYYEWIAKKAVEHQYQNMIDGFNHSFKLPNNSICKAARIQGFIEIEIFSEIKQQFLYAGTFTQLFHIPKYESKIGFLGAQLLNFTLSEDLTQLFVADKSQVVGQTGVAIYIGNEIDDQKMQQKEEQNQQQAKDDEEKKQQMNKQDEI